MQVVYVCNGYTLPIRVETGMPQPILRGRSQHDDPRGEWVGLDLEKTLSVLHHFENCKIKPIEICMSETACIALLSARTLEIKPEDRTIGVAAQKSRRPVTVDEWREFFAELYSNASCDPFRYAMIAAWDVLAERGDPAVFLDLDRDNDFHHLSVRLTGVFARELRLATPDVVKPSVSEQLRSKVDEYYEAGEKKDKIIASLRDALRIRRSRQQVTTDDPTGDDIAPDA